MKKWLCLISLMLFFVANTNAAKNDFLGAREVVATKGGVQYTKSSLKLGQEMHKAYKVGDVVEGVAMKEFRRIPGIRPDFVDFNTKTIYKLKPFNPKAMKQGCKQIPKPISTEIRRYLENCFRYLLKAIKWRKRI